MHESISGPARHFSTATDPESKFVFCVRLVHHRRKTVAVIAIERGTSGSGGCGGGRRARGLRRGRATDETEAHNEDYKTKEWVEFFHVKALSNEHATDFCKGGLTFSAYK